MYIMLSMHAAPHVYIRPVAVESPHVSFTCLNLNHVATVDDDHPVVIPGLRAGTCVVLRGSLLIVCKQVRLSFM